MTPSARPGRGEGAPLEPGDALEVLAGATSKRLEALARLGLTDIEDLLRLAPRRYEDRRHPTAIADLVAEDRALVVAKVLESRSVRARGGLTILEALVADETGQIMARWFQRGFQRRPLPHGAWVALYGPAKKKGRKLELSGPQLELLPAPDAPPDPTGMPGAFSIVPVHPLTTGLSAAVMRRFVWQALTAAERVVDAVPASLRRSLDLPDLGAALHDLHFPSSLGVAEAARRRLAFDELLVHEILLARRRLRRRQETGPAIPIDARLDDRIRQRIPFQLTPGQERVVREIAQDLAATHPMNRLVQGDVGSGKTAVAAYAMLATVAAGHQAAFMAPTEVLARQHQATLETLLQGSRVRLETLLGGRRGKARERALARVAAGDVDIVIGTHAVISGGVAFARLGLVVVDEQHKFGVRQRHQLVAKGQDDGVRPHALVMTATPIPRTLALAVYGDLDLSVIDGRPPGRKPVETWVVGPREGRRVFDRVQAELDAGHQAFVIYPLVGESDKLGLRDAIDGQTRWARALPARRVGLLHGRMKRDEKEEAMDAFRQGRTDVLVATVVIEVGVDVPNATVLVVEHAERFGLSQLHQLRGRIGRGDAGGLCVLVDRAKEGRPARLDVLAATEDGFLIAEEDLKLRGIGDVLGTRQHGQPLLSAARLPRDLPVLVQAREAATTILRSDPRLERPAARGLRALVRQRIRATGGDLGG